MAPKCSYCNDLRQVLRTLVSTLAVKFKFPGAWVTSLYAEFLGNVLPLSYTSSPSLLNFHPHQYEAYTELSQGIPEVWEFHPLSALHLASFSLSSIHSIIIY